MTRMHRRHFLAGVSGAAAAALWPCWLAAQRGRTRLVLLGTGGGPRPRKANSASAQVIVIDGAAYVIDCGDGVARQLAFAGVPLPTLRHIFLTHQHSDHTADYGNLIWLAWAAGLRTRVDTWGPPPLEKMTRLFFEMNAADIDTRIADEGRVPLAPLVHVHELTAAGLVFQDEHVKVTSALVRHPPVVPAFGYRFDAVDRSIVISGDTAPSDELIALARGADVLVHEALYLPAAPGEPGSALRQHVVDSHTPVEEAGRIAAEAGVKTLVLSHFVPAENPPITDDQWLAGARTHFSGRIVVGRDLLEL